MSVDFTAKLGFLLLRPQLEGLVLLEGHREVAHALIVVECRFQEEQALEEEDLTGSSTGGDATNTVCL